MKNLNRRWIIASVVCATSICGGAPAHAAKTWTSLHTSWSITLDNAVIYVNSADMPANCAFTRAELSTAATLSGSTTYAKELYAFILASSARDLPLRIVYETTETQCKIYGAKNN